LTASSPSGRQMDGVEMAIMSNRLEGVARKMANTLLRSGRSGVLNIARDFSCCIVTSDHRLLVTAESLPIHVLSGPDIMARAMCALHPKLQRGDAFLHNSPYHGNSHPADHTILVPVIDGEGRHRFTVVAKAHQADCGNAMPTTYMSGAEDVYAEGALIFPAVRVQKDYHDVEDIIRMCEMRIRVPEQWWGDYLAMIGAARIGERELLALADEIGWETLDEFTTAWFDYSERLMEDAVRRLPAGRAARTCTHDPMKGTPEGGIPVTCTVAVDPEAGRITVDLTENLDSLPCGLNLSEACARTAAMIGVFNSLDHRVPKNAGAFRRLDIRLREGCVVGIPRHPTSCSAATTNVADRVSNAVQGAIAALGEGHGMAEGGSVLPPSAAVVSGIDPRTGRPFVNQLFLGISGGAGAPSTDGWLTILHTGNAGLCFQDSVELDELRHPLFVAERYLVADSEGAGQFRGAPSIYCSYGPQDCVMDAVYASDGTVHAAAGVRGGLAGACADQERIGADGARQRLPSAARVTLRPGELIVSISAGGGGYGAPEMRDPERVAHDVREGIVSRARARDVYRVAVDVAGMIDAEETSRLRAAAN
jgi:N-methylhydantoinase B